MSSRLTYEGGYDGFGTRAAMAAELARLKAERDALRLSLWLVSFLRAGRCERRGHRP